MVPYQQMDFVLWFSRFCARGGADSTHRWWVGVSLKAHQASTKLLEHPKKEWHQIESHLCVSLEFSMFMVPITIVDGRNPTNQLRLVVYPIIYRVLVLGPSQVVSRISAVNSIST